MGFWQKARLVAVTVTVTSAAWIVAGAIYLDSLAPVPTGAPARFLGESAAARVSPPAGQDRGVMTSLLQLRGAIAIPVQGVQASQLVDTYTQSRAGGLRVHDAIDILAPVGTPVLAAAPGRVEKLFLSHDGGNTIYVRSPDGMTIYYYAHLDHYAPGLAEGQTVGAGQEIAAVGATGNADPAAPHLHFAVKAATPQTPWHEGEPINPYPLLGGK
ncbi:M23 family metallopeptidase [Novosphingobium lentum]|uniref:M23 family metallopeptidase n=1 Tax=Novosphingobium lentum TaxID=145287 RepID=UPI0008347492|nr:M23 family metallopeptidase [Novosphingobium lentum]